MENVSTINTTFCHNMKSGSRSPHAIEINIGKKRLLGSCGTIFEKDKMWKKSLLSASAHSALIVENSNPKFDTDLIKTSFYKRYQKNGSEFIKTPFPRINDRKR